jgi:tetratricopeptide (TPR) repeat protein
MQPPNQPRRVVPRWHSPGATALRSEARSLKPPGARDTRVSQELAKLKGEGRKQATEWRFVGDLLSVAVATGDIATARDTAETLVRLNAPVSTLARSMAQGVMRPPSAPAQLSSSPDDTYADELITAGRIAALRQRLNSAPRSPLLWVERALLYTTLGQAAQAQQCMAIALALAPEDRYVLRSAARMFVHYEDPQRAHQLLADAEMTARDPWLAAAEIAAASLADTSPRHLKAARAMLDNGHFAPAHLTELASSVGTMELEAGALKKAKRLFTLSLEAPNENALAQAEWATRRVSLRELSARVEEVPESFEARALAAAAGQRIPEALREGWNWLFDQPFSREPALFGSYHAAKSQRFEESAEFARRGLIANPDEPILRNNLAFAQARMGDVEDAARTLAQIDRAKLDEDTSATVTATEGLVAFRSGRAEEGRKLYLDAIQRTRRAANKALAHVMLATEELRTSLATAPETVALARQAADKGLPGEERLWLDHLQAIEFVLPSKMR